MIETSHAARIVVTLFLGALLAVVALRLLNGDINTRYLFFGRSKGGAHYFSPGRVQLFIITISVAFNYLLNTFSNPQAGLADVSPETLALLGGSQVLYLGGKAYSRFFGAMSMKG